jgi:hypothetical protein
VTLRIRETDFQSAVIEAAQFLGWRVAHFRAGRTANGWRTPVAGDGAGFPDLVLVRGPRLVVAELKSHRGQVTSRQQLWLDDLVAVPGIEVHVWRPDDWTQIENTLRHETR